MRIRAQNRARKMTLIDMLFAALSICDTSQWIIDDAYTEFSPRRFKSKNDRF